MTAFSLDLSGPFARGESVVGLGGPNQAGHFGDNWYIRSGMDLGAARGAVVRAPFDARITVFHRHNPEADQGLVYGAQLFMRAPNDMVSVFFTHISDVPSGLSIGSPVSRGDVLGTVFRFGNISPHLHMAIAEIVGGFPGGTFVGVNNLYVLFQRISASNRVTVVFNQDGSPPAVAGGAPGDNDTPALEKGERGATVRNLQGLLNARMPDLAALDVDGIFGAATDARVREFQRRSGLEVDGVVGPDTWRALTR